MASNDSIRKTLTVAVTLCLACSIVVASAAVLLKPRQLTNKSLDKQKNILQVAGLLDQGGNIADLYERYVEARVINLQTGEYADDIDPATFDQRKTAKDPATSTALAPTEDIAGIKRKPQYASVYLIKDNGATRYVILPISGYGLWSTLHGFIALENDLTTVYGISFYEHAETPGLGGEVDNTGWKAKWRGKKLFDPAGEPALGLIKGIVNTSAPNAEYQIDGLAGATLTGQGVSNMLQFWFSAQGYQPFLAKLNLNLEN